MTIFPGLVRKACRAMPTQRLPPAGPTMLAADDGIPDFGYEISGDIRCRFCHPVSELRFLITGIVVCPASGIVVYRSRFSSLVSLRRVSEHSFS